MTKNNDLGAQARQLGQQALKLANSARLEAGRYVQQHSSTIDAAIDKATQAVERKTGKDHHGTAAKVKDAAAKGAALLADEGKGTTTDASTTGTTGSASGPAASWPDASGGRAEMPTIPTSRPGEEPQDTLPGTPGTPGAPGAAG